MIFYVLCYFQIYFDELKFPTVFFSLNEYEGAVTKQTDEKVVSLKKALDVKNEEVADLEAR